METQVADDQLPGRDERMSRSMKQLLLVLNCILLGLGNCGGPLLMRLYYLRGGKMIWLASWIETGGWPVILVPFLLSFWYRRSKGRQQTKLFSMKPLLFAACSVIGVLTGLDDFLYAYGSSLLPVSTSSLIISTQLAFTAIFALLLVKQKFTFYSINSIFLLVLAAVVLALHNNSDRPAHESKAQYCLGFLMTLGASVLYGFVLPLIELTYKKARQAITYSLVMEMQMVIAIFATAFCTIGMLAKQNFQAIPREAREFELGEAKYYVVIVWCSIFWQMFFLGAVGVIFTASSLVSGIVIATLLPVIEILAVIFYQESFKAEKGISLVLSIWGFISYFYDDLKKIKGKDQRPQLVLPQSSVPL